MRVWDWKYIIMKILLKCVAILWIVSMHSESFAAAIVLKFIILLYMILYIIVGNLHEMTKIHSLLREAQKIMT